MIRLRGASEHNLQGVDVDIPLQAFVVCTGVSGSGKSSFAFATLAAESQRRFLRGRTRKPAFQSLSGLPPVLAFPQTGGERGTVAQVADIFPLLRAEWIARGEIFCPDCGQKVEVLGVDAVVKRLEDGPAGSRLMLMAPVFRQQKTGIKAVLAELGRAGFLRVRLDGKVLEIEEIGVVDARIPHDLDVVVDRIKRDPERRERLQESVETGMKIGKGSLIVEEAGRLVSYRNRYQCSNCERMLKAPSLQLFSWNSPEGWCSECRGQGCDVCGGTRLCAEARAVKLGGRSLPEVLAASVATLRDWWTGQEELKRRLDFLCRLGLGYLSLNRDVRTLSVGEFQRVRLASFAATPLEGVLYLLDEPAAGLHPSETKEMIGFFRELIGNGASLLVVAHDREVIRAADWVLEMGPGAGSQGGRLIFAGTPSQLMVADTPTGIWLSGRERIGEPTKRTVTGWVELEEASGHGLRVPRLSLPLGVLLGVHGPSGTGKRSLILQTAGRALARQCGTEGPEPLPYGRLSGRVERVVWGESGHRGRAATVATLSGVWGGVRALLAQTPEAKQRGFGAERFGFHAGGGRCVACKGTGVRRLDPDGAAGLEVLCEVCEGRRFDGATLSVRWKDRSVADLLAMRIQEARRFFTHHRKLARVLERLESLGLGYLTLGQRGEELSGGERTRLRLAQDLGHTTDLVGSLYLLEEPTRGLHPADVEGLVRSLRGLVDGGATVWVVDSDPGFLAACDLRLEMPSLTLESGLT